MNPVVGSRVITGLTSSRNQWYTTRGKATAGSTRVPTYGPDLVLLWFVAFCRPVFFVRSTFVFIIFTLRYDRFIFLVASTSTLTPRTVSNNRRINFYSCTSAHRSRRVYFTCFALVAVAPPSFHVYPLWSLSCFLRYDASECCVEKHPIIRPYVLIVAVAADFVFLTRRV
jgi:hypothetical protein